MTEDTVEVEGLAERVERILNTPIYRPDDHEQPGADLEVANNGDGNTTLYDPDRSGERWLTIDTAHVRHVWRDAR